MASAEDDLGTSDRIPARHEPPGPFAYHFSPTPAGVRVARYVLSAWLERQPGVNTDAIDDLLVVCSELCTNAASHSSGHDMAAVLSARIDRDSVVLEVSDDGGGFPFGGGGHIKAAEAAAESGRGLFIVAALTDEMTVESTGERTLVRVRRNGMLNRDAAGAHGADEAMSADFRSGEGGRRDDREDRDDTSPRRAHPSNGAAHHGTPDTMANGTDGRASHNGFASAGD